MLLFPNTVKTTTDTHFPSENVGVVKRIMAVHFNNLKLFNGVNLDYSDFKSGPVQLQLFWECICYVFFIPFHSVPSIWTFCTL